MSNIKYPSQDITWVTTSANRMYPSEDITGLLPLQIEYTHHKISQGLLTIANVNYLSQNITSFTNHFKQNILIRRYHRDNPP